MNTEDDLAGDIRAAVEAQKGDTGAAGAATQVDGHQQAAPATQTGAEGAQTDGEAGGEAATDVRARDDAGRFAKKADAGDTQDQAGSAEHTGEGEQDGTDLPQLVPPKGWTPAAKALFADLPPLVRQEIVRREADTAKGVDQLRQKYKPYDELDSLFEPHKHELALRGLTVPSYVQALVTADQMLRTNPQQALAMIAQQYGIPLNQAAPNTAQQQGYTPQNLPPEIQGLVQEVSTLKQTLTAQQQQAENARRQEVANTIEAFASDPAHVYFDNVKDQMAVFIQSGQAADLKSAYDMACWANPEVRAVLQQENQRKAQAASIEASRAKAAGAKQAAGSVTGSPAPGATQAAANQNATLEEDIRAAVAEVRNR